LERAIGRSNSVVEVLLSTFNGESYLLQQIDSIRNQVGVETRVVVSDDGSTDQTIFLLDEYKKQNPYCSIEVFRGPQNGFAQNFLSLIYRASLEANFYAFCDQDDIWDPEKLNAAISYIEAAQLDSNIPALYVSNVRIMNSLSTGQNTRLFTKIDQPEIRRLATGNIAPGFTFVMNRALLQLLRKSNFLPVPAHDWYTILVATTCGGKVLVDQSTYSAYRQHSLNHIGASRSLLASLNRLFSGQYIENVFQMELALKEFEPFMTNEGKDLLAFYNALHLGYFRRICALVSFRPKRSSFVESAVFWGFLAFVPFVLRKRRFR
jgi:glycosyltransferase involved in cell wall biosynthesis